MGLSISGLYSGLDPQSIVSQLMTSASAPKTALQTQLTTLQTQESSYQSINTKFQALLSAAQAVTDPATWSSTTAASSSPTVAVSSSSSAAAQSLTFSVTQTAAAQTSLSTETWASTSDGYGLASPMTVYSVAADGTKTARPTQITVGGSGTLADAVSAINSSGLGLRAAAVPTTGGYRLQVSAASTGQANAFQLGDDGDFTTITRAADAQITVGSGSGSTGYTVNSSTNTFTNLIPGVTLTASGKATDVTVTVQSDPDAVATKMQAFVDAANNVLSEIAKQTATGVSGSGTSSGSAGPLAGDFTMQTLASKVRGLVTAAFGTASPASIGLQLSTYDGNAADETITFDATAFKTALAADPAGTKQMVTTGSAIAVSSDTSTQGVVKRLQALAGTATNVVSGTITTLTKGLDSREADLQDQIDDWTDRLALQQQSLLTQYTNLQTALASLSTQQSWLNSMFGSLDGSSSSSSSSASSSSSSS